MPQKNTKQLVQNNNKKFLNTYFIKSSFVISELLFQLLPKSGGIFTVYVLSIKEEVLNLALLCLSACPLLAECR